MKYETPEVTVLTTAINAVQGTGNSKSATPSQDGALYEDPAAYADWE